MLQCDSLPSAIDTFDDLLRAAGLHAYGRNTDRLKIDNVTNAQELAEALVSTQDVWMAHVYEEDAPDVEAALKEHGSNTVTHIKNEGDNLFKAGVLPAAVARWRLALGALLSEQLAGSAAPTLLNLRAPLWDTVLFSVLLGECPLLAA